MTLTNLIRKHYAANYIFNLIENGYDITRTILEELKDNGFDVSKINESKFAAYTSKIPFQHRSVKRVGYDKIIEGKVVSHTK